MPPQQGVGADDRGHYRKQLVAELLGPDCESAALLVVESQTPIAELLSQHLVLFAEIVNDVLLLLVEPAGESDGDELQRIERH